MSRASLRALALLALALLLAGAAFLARRWSSSPQPGVTYGPPPTIPLADKSVGVSTDLTRLDAAARQAALSSMEAAGFHWLRQRFPWDAIEPSPGTYDWAVWDKLVAEAGRHNLAIIAVLDGSPAWARAAEDQGNPLAPPVELRDLGRFAAALAGRYGAAIDYYQIWDEPNIAPHWGAREIDPLAYGHLLREAAVQIRAADPSAFILTAALAPNVEPGGANMNELAFLDSLYQQGAGEWFDVVAAQPYAFDQPTGAPPDPAQLNWNRVALLRGVMEAHGDAATAVWAVSFGLNTTDGQGVIDTMSQARQSWPWLGPMLWAAWSPDDAHGQYALLGPDGQPGPAYVALQAWSVAPAVAWPGVYPASDASGRYDGGWQVTPSGADIGGSGDRLSISFWGTRLDLTVRRGDYRAFLFVTVDGQPANALPRDSEGRAYAVLYDPLNETATVTLAQGLPLGPHLAEIVADRGWGQWAIAGWTVSREMPRHLPGLPAGLAALAVLALGATLYRAWPARAAGLDLFRRMQRRYAALGEAPALVLTLATALAFWLMLGTVPSLMALGLLAWLLLLRPEMGLPLIALALPFYQVGKPLLGKVFSMPEILTLLTAAAWLANRLLSPLRGACPERLRGELEGGKVRPSPWRGELEGGEVETRAESLPPSVPPAGGEARPSPRWGACPERLRGELEGGRSTLRQLTALDWGIFALVLLGAASLLWADRGREAAREFRTVVLESAVFYGLLRAMVHDRRQVWRLVDAWVLGGVLIALIGIGQWLLGQNLITADGVWRVRGFYGSPNNLALYLGRILPLTLVIAGATHLKRVAPVSARRRWAYGLAALVVAAALFLTYSRGAWLIGVPASLLFLAALRSRRTLAIALGLLFVLAIVVFLFLGSGRLTSLLDTSEGTTFFRLQLWQSSWAMIRDHPILGVGLDNFLYQYRTHYVLPTAWEEFDLSHPHNFVFDFWLRLGLPGLLLVLFLLIVFFRQGWRAYRRLPSGPDRLLVLGLMAGMVDFVAHGLVDNAFFLVDLAFVFALMLAVLQITAGQMQWPDGTSSV
jgi:O-antigen ligase